MIRVGLTGGIGSGKTLIAKVFKNFGIPVFQADRAARSIMEEDPQIRELIIKLFGETLYAEGELDRKALAGILFNTPEALEKINHLVHPRVLDEFSRWCDHQVGSPYAVHEAAILFETGFYRLLDKNILVTAPEEVRIGRVIRRDKTTRENILARIDNQWPDERKIPLADYIINNDERTPVLPAILKIHENLILLSNGKIQ